MGKFLITGALGNVGGYVASYAIEHGMQVKLADIDLERLLSKYGEHSDVAEAVRFDFMDHSTYAQALKDVDRVFIMRPPHLGKPEDLRPFIEALKEVDGLCLVSFLSLIGVEHNPVPPHHKIEGYIEAAGLPYCHIRPSFFMQNLSGIHAFEIKHFDRIVVPVKNALTSFIDAEDIGALIAKLMQEGETHQNTAYSITGPEAIDYWEVAKALSEVLNRNITYANPKPSLAKKYWIKVRGLDPDYASIMGMLYMMTRLGTAKKVTSTFHELMGRAPKGFREFARKNKGAWEH